MSGRNWLRKTIKPLSCVPRKLSWPSTPPMPLSTPSSANRSMNPWGSRESPSPSWYACRTTARLAFSRSVRWRSVSGSADGGTGAESARVAADAWPASVPPASAATVGTAARTALRARNERRFVEDMVIPFDGRGMGLGPAKFEHGNGADSGGLACVLGKAGVAPRLLGIDPVAFSTGQFADGHLVSLGPALGTA